MNKNLKEQVAKNLEKHGMNATDHNVDAVTYAGKGYDAGDRNGYKRGVCTVGGIFAVYGLVAWAMGKLLPSRDRALYKDIAKDLD